MTSSGGLPFAEFIATNLGMNVSGEPAYSDLFLLYPNPAHGIVNIQFLSDASSTGIIQIFDLDGRRLRTAEIEITPGRLDYSFSVEGLIYGAYYLQAIFNDNMKYTKLLVIKK